jgi:hypothetical protein
LGAALLALAQSVHRVRHSVLLDVLLADAGQHALNSADKWQVVGDKSLVFLVKTPAVASAQKPRPADAIALASSVHFIKLSHFRDLRMLYDGQIIHRRIPGKENGPASIGQAAR